MAKSASYMQRYRANGAGSANSAERAGGGAGGSVSAEPEYITADNTVQKYDYKDRVTIITTPQGELHDYSFDSAEQYKEVTQAGALMAGQVDTLYQISAGKNGDISFSVSYGKKVGGSNKYPTYKHEEVGAYYMTKTNGEVEQRGINWNNVKSVSGKTYDIKDNLKQLGFQWDRNSSKWVKR